MKETGGRWESGVEGVGGGGGKTVIKRRAEEKEACEK